MAKNKYWDINPILSKDADYNLVIGERSNGKTYGVLLYALERYFKDGSTFGYIRRWEEDFSGHKGQEVFQAHIANGVITKLSNGRWNSIKYYSRKWYLQKLVVDDKESTIVDDKPFAYAFALTKEEHYKSLSYPTIQTILFDEFLTRGYYLPEEFLSLTSVLSTIIRDRDNVKIFMCGNTVNKYSPYIKEMGLYNVPTQEQGTIDVYAYGDSKLRVAVEYCGEMQKKGKKASNKYFAFDNPKLKMITNGVWELAIYPHCPMEYDKKDIVYNFFIEFADKILHGEIVQKGESEFIFIHPKTTPIKEDGLSLVYSDTTSPLPNHRKNLLKVTTDVERRIVELFRKDKVFYSTNEEGELIRNYLNECQKK